MRSGPRSKALVSTWFDFQPEAVRSVALQLQQAVLAAAPELVETIKWGNLVYQLDGVAVLAIAPHKANVNLQLFNGSELPPELGPLEGSGRGSRSLRFKLHQAVDAVQTEILVAACVAQARRQAAQRAPRMPKQDDVPGD